LGLFFDTLITKDLCSREAVALSLFDCLVLASKPERFFKSFSKHPYIKENLLEIGFDPFFRIKNYAFAFEHYPRELKQKGCKNRLQDFIFSNTVLFRHYFINNQLDQASYFGKILFNKYALSEEELTHVHLFPKMRYLAYKIWYLKMTARSNLLLEEYIEWLLDFCRVEYRKLNKEEQKIAYYNIAEVFSYSNIKQKHIDALKNIFLGLFDLLPSEAYQKPLHRTLSYFEPNGILHKRPLV
jgi:hypothetical protein